MAGPPEITQLLIKWGNGDRAAFDELLPLIYKDLHRMAKRYLRKQSPNHTIQTTALINEAYIRLVDGSKQTWQNRSHFFGVASTAMRHVLVDYARKLNAQKRGGRPAPLNDELVIAADSLGEMIALNDALDDLQKLNPRHARVVELRFFAGLSVQEIAESLNVSPGTVAGDWRAARAWLFTQLSRR